MACFQNSHKHLFKWDALVAHHGKGAHHALKPSLMQQPGFNSSTSLLLYVIHTPSMAIIQLPLSMKRLKNQQKTSVQMTCCAACSLFKRVIRLLVSKAVECTRFVFYVTGSSRNNHPCFVLGRCMKLCVHCDNEMLMLTVCVVVENWT